MLYNIGWSTRNDGSAWTCTELANCCQDICLQSIIHMTGQIYFKAQNPACWFELSTKTRTGLKICCDGNIYPCMVCPSDNCNKLKNLTWNECLFCGVVINFTFLSSNLKHW